MDDNYYQSKKFAGLLKTYEEAIRDHQPLYMEADDLTDIADYYQQRGEFQKAQEAVDYALSLFPNAVAPLAFKARVAALIHGDEKEAWSYLDRIADKTDLDYYYAVAEVMLANKRAQEANQYLEEKYPLIDDEDVEDYVLDVALLFCDYQQMDYAQQWLDRSHSTEEPDYQEVEARIAMDHGDLKESGNCSIACSTAIHLMSAIGTIWPQCNISRMILRPALRVATIRSPSTPTIPMPSSIKPTDSIC